MAKADVVERASGIALDGLLLINKPAGWTSHDVVAKARRLLGMPRIGHTGTLDPAATGLLVLCLGKATRIAEYLANADKEYRTVLRLGVETETQDATGKVVRTTDGPWPDERRIAAVLAGFVGQLQQVPPMYSAVKVKGVPLYKSARAGRTVPRQPRDFTVRSLKILSIVPPDITFDVVCSKGTYVRTLCADIGAALGVGGHLAALERRRVGRFALDEAISVEELAHLSAGRMLAARMIAPAAALTDLPALSIDERAADNLRHGVAVPAAQVAAAAGSWSAGDCVRLLGADGRLLAIGRAPCGPQELAKETAAVIKLEKVLI